MKRMHWIAALGAALVVLVLVGCGSSPSPAAQASRGGSDLPDWYLNPGEVYPDGTYLVSVGTGDTRRAAEQQAMAGLAQSFEASIQVDVTTQERYRDLVTAQGTFSEADVQLAQTTNIQAAQTLLNVQFGEAAVDEQGRVHAIAYIERLPTGRVYQELIEKNNRQVESFLREASGSTDLIREYAFVSAAGLVASNNEVLRNQLMIIAPALAQVTRASYDYDALLQRRTDLASAMRVSVAISGDDGDRIGGVLRQALSQERFPVSDANPVLRVTGRVSIEPIALNPDFESVRWVLNLNMVGPNGSSLVTLDEQGRSSAVTTESAIAFSYRDMQEVVERRFVGAMRRYFDGLVLGD